MVVCLEFRSHRTNWDGLNESFKTVFILVLVLVLVLVLIFIIFDYFSLLFHYFFFFIGVCKMSRPDIIIIIIIIIVVVFAVAITIIIIITVRNSEFRRWRRKHRTTNIINTSIVSPSRIQARALDRISRLVQQFIESLLIIAVCCFAQ